MLRGVLYPEVRVNGSEKKENTRVETGRAEGDRIKRNLFAGALGPIVITIKAPYGCQVSVLLTAQFWFRSSPEVTTVTGVSNVT